MKITKQKTTMHNKALLTPTKNRFLLVRLFKEEPNVVFKDIKGGECQVSYSDEVYAMSMGRLSGINNGEITLSLKIKSAYHSHVYGLNGSYRKY